MASLGGTVTGGSVPPPPPPPHCAETTIVATRTALRTPPRIVRGRIVTRRGGRTRWPPRVTRYRRRSRKDNDCGAEELARPGLSWKCRRQPESVLIVNLFEHRVGQVDA